MTSETRIVDDLRLPIEKPVRVALSVYLKRLLVFVAVVVTSSAVLILPLYLPTGVTLVIIFVSMVVYYTRSTRLFFRELARTRKRREGPVGSVPTRTEGRIRVDFIVWAVCVWAILFAVSFSVFKFGLDIVGVLGLGCLAFILTQWLYTRYFGSVYDLLGNKSIGKFGSGTSDEADEAHKLKDRE